MRAIRARLDPPRGDLYDNTRHSKPVIPAKAGIQGFTATNPQGSQRACSASVRIAITPQRHRDIAARQHASGTAQRTNAPAHPRVPSHRRQHCDCARPSSRKRPFMHACRTQAHEPQRCIADERTDLRERRRYTPAHVLCCARRPAKHSPCPLITTPGTQPESGVQVRLVAGSPKIPKRSHLNPGFKVVSQASSLAEDYFSRNGREITEGELAPVSLCPRDRPARSAIGRAHARIPVKSTQAAHTGAERRHRPLAPTIGTHRRPSQAPPSPIRLSGPRP